MTHDQDVTQLREQIHQLSSMTPKYPGEQEIIADALTTARRRLADLETQTTTHAIHDPSPDPGRTLRPPQPS